MVTVGIILIKSIQFGLKNATTTGVIRCVVVRVLIVYRAIVCFVQITFLRVSIAMDTFVVIAHGAMTNYVYVLRAVLACAALCRLTNCSKGLSPVDDSCNNNYQ